MKVMSSKKRPKGKDLPKIVGAFQAITLSLIGDKGKRSNNYPIEDTKDNLVYQSLKDLETKKATEEMSLLDYGKNNADYSLFKALDIALNDIAKLHEKGEARKYLTELIKINSQFKTVLGHYSQPIAIADLPLKANTRDKRKLESLLLRLEELDEIPENYKIIHYTYGEWLAQAVHGERRFTSEEEGVFSDSLTSAQPYHERIEKTMAKMRNKK